MKSHDENKKHGKKTTRLINLFHLNWSSWGVPPPILDLLSLHIDWKTHLLHLCYSPLLLIRRGASYFFLFFFGNEWIWLAHHSKKLKLWKFPKIECFIMKYKVPPVWPHLYRWKEDNICQNTWDKSEVYGEHVVEHIGNLGNMLKTWWKPNENFKKTHLETKKKWKKNPLPLPPPLPKPLNLDSTKC